MASFNIGEIHPAIIHFPIVLIFITFVFDILYWFKREHFFQILGNWFLFIAVIILIPTVITGFYAKDFYTLDDPDVYRHQIMAIITSLFTLGYAGFRGYALFTNKVYLYTFLLLSLINISLVNLTAEFGGTVVRGKGLIFESSRPNGFPLPYSKVQKNL